MTENKIYNCYICDCDKKEKAESNEKAYEELKSKYKILRDWDLFPTEKQLEENDIVCSAHEGMWKTECFVYKAPENLTEEEVLLILSAGNLEYGGRKIDRFNYEVDYDY